MRISACFPSSWVGNKSSLFQKVRGSVPGETDGDVGRAHDELSGPRVALELLRPHAVRVGQMLTAQPPTSFQSLILKAPHLTLALRKVPPRLPPNAVSGVGRAGGPMRPRSSWGEAELLCCSARLGSGSAQPRLSLGKDRVWTAGSRVLITLLAYLSCPSFPFC